MGVARLSLAYRLWFLMVICNSCGTFAFWFDVCPKLDTPQTLLYRENQCIFNEDGSPLYSKFALQVAEVNGTTLERVVRILQGKQDAYAAILFYASWCPFSRSLRPLFDTLSFRFPGMYHVSVEESAIQPSALSQHGVHSFPVLFLYNKSLKVRYRGPRTVDAISKFYREAAGLKSTQYNEGNSGTAFIQELSKGSTVQDKVTCPYPWVKSPEKWLCDDMYLLLSSAFLVLRILGSLIPYILQKVKYYWGQKESSLEAHRLLLRKMLLREQVSATRGAVKGGFESESSRKGKSVLSVPGWSSSPLAAVTLAETSSRSGGVEDGQENGYGFTSHLWG